MPETEQLSTPCRFHWTSSAGQAGGCKMALGSVRDGKYDGELLWRPQIFQSVNLARDKTEETAYCNQF